MSSRKEKKWLSTEECKSISNVAASRPNRKSWRSCQVSLNDSKPAIRPPRKILRLGQNDANLNETSTPESNKCKVKNIIWDTSKPNSCEPVPCRTVLRKDLQKEEVLPNRKQEQMEHERFLPKNGVLESGRIFREKFDKIDEMRADVPRDVRKVISKCYIDDRTFDNFDNMSYSVSPEKWSISSIENQNLESLYSPLVRRQSVNNEGLKHGQNNKILNSSAGFQITDNNSNIRNKVDSEKSIDVSLEPNLRKSPNRSFNESMNVADHFISEADDTIRQIEFRNGLFNSEKTVDHKQSERFNLSFDSGTKDIRNHSEVSKNNENGAYEEIPQTRNPNISANFGFLTDKNLEDFVENLKEFLQAKIFSPQYMQTEFFDKLDDSIVHGSDCNCLECSKTSLIDPVSFNEINLITTVRVVDSVCDINNGKAQNFEQFMDKSEASDQQNKDSIFSFKETMSIKSNDKNCNTIETNSTESKDNGDLTASFVHKKPITFLSRCENKTANSSIIFKGKFSEYVLPLKGEITPSLLSKNNLRKFHLNILPRSLKGTLSNISNSNSLAVLKGVNLQQNKLETESDFLIKFFIFKYFAGFSLPTKNLSSFYAKKNIDDETVNKGMNINGECKDMKLTIEKEIDPFSYVNKFFLKNTENSLQKNHHSASSNDFLNNNDNNSPERRLILKNTSSLSTTNVQVNKTITNLHREKTYLQLKFIPKSQPHQKKMSGKDNYIKNVFNTTDNESSEVDDFLDQTSLYVKTLKKRKKTFKGSSSRTISHHSKTTESIYLTLNHETEIHECLPDNILSKEEIIPATMLMPDESSKNKFIPREAFDSDSEDLNIPASSSKEIMDSCPKEVNLASTSYPPRTTVGMEDDSDDEINVLSSTESLHNVNRDNDGFSSSKLEANDTDIFYGDWDVILQEDSASENASAKDEFMTDPISRPNLVNTDNPISSGRRSPVDSDDDFRCVFSSEDDNEAKNETTSSPKEAASDFTDDTTVEFEDLDHLLEISDYSGPNLADQNDDDDDDDDSDSVLSLYAPSSASFLDENEANDFDKMLVENLSFEEECGTESGNVEAPTLDNVKEDFIPKNQCSPSKQELNTQVEDFLVPVGFCYQFVKKGQCSKLAACHFKHEHPSKEELLSFSFSEECKNGKLTKAFDLFVLLKELNCNSLEKTGLLLRNCLSQSNSDMAFRLIPDLIHYKMLTHKIVHDIFLICSSCPFKYEEKLWKLYETMVLLNLCPSLNSLRILLQIYYEMLNWSKIWQILLNTNLVEPLSVIPIPIYHGALTFVIGDPSCQYLPQAVDWISRSAVDDLWNIEPCLLYHLSALFKTKGYSNAYRILYEHLQQINTFPEKVVFTENIDEPETNTEYISCLQNIQEIQANQNWLQLSDIFIHIYENAKLNSSWFIQPIVKAFLKIENVSIMTNVFNDFVNNTCNQFKNLVKENSSYPVSGCQRQLVRVITDLIGFCHNNKKISEGNQIFSTLLKNELEFVLKDHLESIPHESVLFVLDICLHSQEPLKAILLLEGLGWFCELPPAGFINNLHSKQWLKRLLEGLIEQLSNSDKLTNGCRVFSLFVSIIQEETNHWHTGDKLFPVNLRQYPCINFTDLMKVSNKFFLKCLIRENIDSAIYAYNLIKPLLLQINPRCCNMAVFRALLVAAHLGPRIPPCVQELYNFCARHLEIYPPQKLLRPPWTLEIVLHLTNVEMHLIMEDFLECLYNILCDQSMTCQQITTDDLQLSVMVRDNIVVDMFLPEISYLRNVPVNQMEVLQQALFVLQMCVVPPLQAKMNNSQTGLLVNPESLKHFIFVKDSQRRNQGQFHPLTNKKPQAKFRGKGKFRY